MLAQRGTESFQYMNKIVNLIENNINLRLKELGLTRAQFEIIIYVLRQENRCTTQRSIEKKFGLSHTTVIGILKRLQKNGFIEISVDLKDRRQRNITVTEKTLGIEAEAVKIHRETEEYFCNRFTDEQMELFLKALETVYEILTNYNGEEKVK